jgi:hypothetical protein
MNKSQSDSTFELFEIEKKLKIRSRLNILNQVM